MLWYSFQKREEPEMAWRTAYSLDTILAEINTHAPRRSKASDGSIGDPAHSVRVSDHNVNSRGVVRARDFTHDPAGGLDCNDLASRLEKRLRSGDHPALGSGAYIIWNRRIISRDRIHEGWRPYLLSNPHTKHLHLSVATAASGYDSTVSWGLWTPDKENTVARPFLVRRAIKSYDKTIKRINRQLATRPGETQTRRLIESRALAEMGKAKLKEINKR